MIALIAVLGGIQFMKLLRHFRIVSNAIQVLNSLCPSVSRVLLAVSENMRSQRALQIVLVAKQDDIKIKNQAPAVLVVLLDGI